MPGFSKWSPSLRSPHQNPVRTSPSPICATCPVHLILLDMINSSSSIFEKLPLQNIAPYYLNSLKMLINQSTSRILFTTLSNLDLYQDSTANNFHKALLEALFA
jgi:hypothetical protein